jgi:hypothetical protein
LLDKLGTTPLFIDKGAAALYNSNHAENTKGCST